MWDLSGSGQYFRDTTSPVSAQPVTLSAWVNLDRTDIEQVLVTLGHGGVAFGNRLDMRLKNGKFEANVWNESFDAAAVGATSPSSGTLYHVTAVFASTTSRIIYLNGVSDGTDTTSSTIPHSFDRHCVGVYHHADAALLDGKIGEVGIWNVALDAAEVAALAKGFSPLLVRPGSLQAYYPMLGNAGSTEVSAIRAATLTKTGSPTKAAHPRVYMPALAQQGIEGAGVTSFTGTGVFTLPSLTFSAAGTFPYQGTGAFTLPSLTTTAAGTLTFTGTSGFTLPALTTAATATLTFTGTSGFTLPSLSTDAAGSFTEAGNFSGTAAFTMPALTTAAVGTVTFVADAPFLLPALSFDATGWATATGTGAFTLPSLTTSAAGTGGEVVETARTVPPAGGGSDNRKGERRKRRPYILPDGRRIWLYPEEIADLVARGNLPAAQKPAERVQAAPVPEGAPTPARISLPPVRDRSADIARLVNEARAAGRLAEMVAGMAQGLAAQQAAAMAAEDQRLRRRRRAAALLLLQ